MQVTHSVAGSPLPVHCRKGEGGALTLLLER